MTILGAILLAQAALPATTADAQAEEIVVIGQKLQNWKGTWKSHKGGFLCKTTGSTGDKAVDAIGCGALTVCITPHVAEFQAIADSKDDRNSRNARITALMQSLMPCVTAERKRGIAALANQRAAAR